MARHAILWTLVLVACALEAVSGAAAAKGGRGSKHDPDFPQPVAHGKPCSVKSPECVDTYTEADAKRLAEIGYFGQVALAPDLPPSLARDLRSREKPKHKRKATCRGEEGEKGCRPRPQRKRGGEGAQRNAKERKGRKGSRKGQREQDPSKPPKGSPEEQQARKERKQQQRRQRKQKTNAPPSSPSGAAASSPLQ